MKSSGFSEAGLAQDTVSEREFNDAIGERWCEFAEENPTAEIVTSKGLALKVFRIPHITRIKVEYQAFLPEQEKVKNFREAEIPVAWMYTQFVSRGRLQITNAQVKAFEDDDYRKKGIGEALYDLIESDFQKAGGVRLEPDFGNQSPNATAFWRKRRPSLDIELPGWDQKGYKPPRVYWEKEI